MAGVSEVAGGVLGGWVVAAADVAALGAAPQMEPPAAVGVALDAAGPAGRDAGVDSGVLGHEGSWAGSGSAAVRGRSTWKRVAPGTDSTFRSPWCLLTTIRQEISSHSPVPSPTGLVVTNGSKIRSRISAGTPGPVSRNSTSSRSCTTAVRTVNVPSSPVLLMAETALSIRLVHTWFSSAG